MINAAAGIAAGDHGPVVCQLGDAVAKIGCHPHIVLRIYPMPEGAGPQQTISVTLVPSSETRVTVLED